jgi:uncharacterized membrane protein
MAAGGWRSGLEPRFAAALAYLGGALTGILFLIIEKQDRFVRFHAMQSTMTFLGVIVVHFVLRGVPVIGPVLTFAFVVGIVILWVILIVKAFSGERYKLPYIGDWAEQQIK